MEKTQINVEAIDSDDSETNQVIDSVSKTDSDEFKSETSSEMSNVTYEDSDSVTSLESISVPISTEREAYIKSGNL